MRKLLALLGLLMAAAAPAGETPPVAARVLVQTALTAGLAHHDAKAVWALLAPGDPLALVREPSNRDDPDAVRVEWQGRLLGYLPRADNADVARMLDRGQPLAASIRSVARYRNHRRKLEIDIHASW
jgi:hypothetical protein